MMGHESRFVDGLRVTDAQTMEIAEMVLGKVNKSLVQMLEKLGVKAAGISGKDGGTFKVDKKYINGQDIGFVGSIREVDTKLIDTLLDNDFVPVISPIGLDDDYNNYNINADDAACSVATAIKAEKLVFLTDIEGVYADTEDKASLISVLTLKKADELLESGFIGGGMLPKLKNCVDAVRNSVSRVHILDGRIEHCLLLEFFTNRGIGTAIVSEENIFDNEL
jgi:acetylglutamate kinase